MTQEEVIRRLADLRVNMAMERAIFEACGDRGGPNERWIDELSAIIGALVEELAKE
jgi:hypothetical protein